MKDNIFATRDADGIATKKDIRVKFVGQCDLLSSYLSYLFHIIKVKHLQDICKELSFIMSYVIGYKESFDYNEFKDAFTILSNNTDKIKVPFAGLRQLGTTKKSSLVHIARAITRQTELCYLETLPDNLELVNGTETIIAQYLNKLSLYLYYIALKYER